MSRCRHCTAEVPRAFDVCWNCGIPAQGDYDPAHARKDAPPGSASVSETQGSETQEPTLDADSHSDVTPFRFSLGKLFLLTTIVTMGLAMWVSEDATFLISAVIITNVIGVFIGLFVTAIGERPTDGSSRYDDEASNHVDDEFDSNAGL